MAQISEEIIVVKISQLVREAQEPVLVSDSTLQNLEHLAQELLGPGIIVEVERP